MRIEVYGQGNAMHTKTPGSHIEFVVGVDGGGTGTRARITNTQGRVLGEGHSGPSGLLQGVGQAWENLGLAIQRAMHNAPDGAASALQMHNTALGLGLAGANDAQLKQQLLECNPGYVNVQVESDAFTALLGAHRGAPGAIVIAGTGSVAQALFADGRRSIAGGWGFPSGDDGSGAVMGLKAMNLAQRALDGRHAGGPLASAVLANTGGNWDAMLAWCCNAGQSRFATLAPLVFEHEDQDENAAALIAESVTAIDRLAHAIDPSGQLPLSILGSIGKRLAERLPEQTRQRLVRAQGDAMDGALALSRFAINTD